MPPAPSHSDGDEPEWLRRSAVVSGGAGGREYTAAAVAPRWWERWEPRSWAAVVVVVGASVVVGAAEVGTAVGSTTGVSRSATRAKAAETPAASSAEVTLPSERRLARSVSGVVRLMASTCSPWTAAMAWSSVAVLPSSLPSDRITSTLRSAAGVNCWSAAVTAS